MVKINPVTPSFLLSDEIHKFSPVNQDLLARVSEIYPDCSEDSSHEKSIDISCTEEKSLLTDLRKAAFLDPSNEKVWKAIACINRKHDLRQHAVFYERLAQRMGKSDKEIVDDIVKRADHQGVFLSFFTSDEMQDAFNRNPAFFLLMAKDLIKKKCPLFMREYCNAILDIVMENLDVFFDPKDFLLSAISWNTHDLSRNVINNHLPDLIEKIIDHPNAVNENIFDWLVLSIAYSAKDIPEYKNLFEEIIDHPNVGVDKLRYYLDNILYNAKDIPASKEIFEIIIDHTKADKDILISSVSSIIQFPKDIHKFKEFFEIIIDHPKADKEVLIKSITSINYFIKNIPKLKELYEIIIDHPKADKEVLIKSASFITERAKNISEFEELIKKIINDLEDDKDALQDIRISIIIHSRRYDIPEFKELLGIVDSMISSDDK